MAAANFVSEVYDALIAAGVDDAKARAAARAVPIFADAATRADIANLRAEIFRALRLQAAGIVVVITGILKLLA